MSLGKQPWLAGGAVRAERQLSKLTSTFVDFYFSKKSTIFEVNKGCHESDATVLESTNRTPFSKTTMVAPMFRVLPWAVRSDPGSYFSQMFEPKIQNIIILHCHFIVLSGFIAGTSDIRTIFFCFIN